MQRLHTKQRAPPVRAIRYYVNQRDALRHFLEEGRVPIHKNAPEAALRSSCSDSRTGCTSENESGLKWYCTFLLAHRVV
jgi:hypothetical protein